jgi:hypothetical protein
VCGISKFVGSEICLHLLYVAVMLLVFTKILLDKIKIITAQNGGIFFLKQNWDNKAKK